MGQIFISAAHKSSGKTTISIGLCAALKDSGLVVQPFKKGPDYIDPLWLTQATGRACYNLDFYTMSIDEIIDTYQTHCYKADFAVIEGNKGLYDGLDLDGSNSNAALAKHLNTPIILVLDAQGMTRGIAPLILGYQQFDNQINIAGVILNKLGGSRHESKLRRVIEHYTDVKVVGAVHRDDDLHIDERHLGLIPSNEVESSEKYIKLISDRIRNSVDLESVIEVGQQQPLTCNKPPVTMAHKQDIRIGIAQDDAFGFYYPGDLLALEKAGAKLVKFSPTHDKELPEVDGLFIGGGFPETKMSLLEENHTMRQSILSAIEKGLPVYAECGGLMYLCSEIIWNNNSCKMVGAIAADVRMHNKPVGRGYIQLEETDQAIWPKDDDNKGTVFNAHEFHYSSIENLKKNYQYAYEVKRGYGIDGINDGIIYKNVLGSYAHLRDTKNNHWADRFTRFIRSTKDNLNKVEGNTCLQ